MHWALQIGDLSQCAVLLALPLVSCLEKLWFSKVKIKKASPSLNMKSNKMIWVTFPALESGHHQNPAEIF